MNIRHFNIHSSAEALPDSMAHGQQAVRLRLMRHQVLVGNLANADTPGYRARDFDFAQALGQAMGGAGVAVGLSTRHERHFATGPGARSDQGPALAYRHGVQPAIDGNTVEPDLERSHLLKNAFMAEASMQFLGSVFRSRLMALTGQPQ